MEERKQIYTAIAVTYIACYGYSLFWFVSTLIEFGRWGFQLSFFVRYIPTFLALTGVIIFITSQFKRSNLLRVIMCMEIISFPFLLYWYINFFTKTYGPYNSTPQVNWTFYVGSVVNLSIFVASVIGLRLLSFDKTAALTVISYGAESNAQFSPVDAGIRFANRLIDAVVILYILFTNIITLKGFSDNYFDFKPQFLFVLEIPFLLIYYTILEGIFNTTAGKCATNTIIVNEQGERPSFAQILGRSFCRLIPFEAFSFFSAGARGWHDTLTNTYVTTGVNKDDAAIHEITLDAELNSY